MSDGGAEHAAVPTLHAATSPDASYGFAGPGVRPWARPAPWLTSRHLTRVARLDA